MKNILNKKIMKMVMIVLFIILITGCSSTNSPQSDYTNFDEDELEDYNYNDELEDYYYDSVKNW